MAAKAIVLLGLLISILSASTLFVFCVVNGATSSNALQFISSFGYEDVGPIAPRFIPMIKGLLIASVGGFFLAAIGLFWVVVSGTALIVVDMWSRFFGR